MKQEGVGIVHVVLLIAQRVDDTLNSGNVENVCQSHQLEHCQAPNIINN